MFSTYLNSENSSCNTEFTIQLYHGTFSRFCVWQKACKNSVPDWFTVSISEVFLTNGSGWAPLSQSTPFVLIPPQPNHKHIFLITTVLQWLHTTSKQMYTFFFSTNYPLLSAAGGPSAVYIFSICFGSPGSFALKNHVRGISARHRWPASQYSL